ncbi:MAG: MFS transporter [Holosporales bacterium]|nr:MFS transporter [Holosporales bacterium]
MTKYNNSFWLISVVLFSTVATMMITAILPAYFKSLHLTYEQVGRIEGWSAFIAFFSKFFAGICSDRIQKRKLLVLLGTGLNVLSKATFALATGFVSIFAVQVCDRFAKGMRSCPLDAMISDSAGKRTRPYGLKHVAFFIGSILGSYITYKLLNNTQIGIKSIFSIATIPAIFAFLIASNKLKDAESKEEEPKVSPIFAIASIDQRLWKLYGVLFLLMFARFSISFLGLRSISFGTQVASIPKIYILYDFSAAFAALIWSGLASKIRQGLLFKSALVFHIMAHCILMVSHHYWMLFSGIVLSGVHAGMSQGSIMFMISSHTERYNRATAFSIYSLVAGLGLLLSNRLAGKLSTIDSSLAFLGGATFCAIALVVFILLEKKR